MPVGDPFLNIGKGSEERGVTARTGAPPHLAYSLAVLPARSSVIVLNALAHGLR